MGLKPIWFSFGYFYRHGTCMVTFADWEQVEIYQNAI